MCIIHHHNVCRMEHSLCVGGAGSRYLGCRCSPIEWARRIVVPNRVHASRKRPLFVRNGPIMMRAWIPSSVGLCMKEAIRSACMAAATVVLVRHLECHSWRSTDCTHFLSPIPLSWFRLSTGLQICPMRSTAIQGLTRRIIERAYRDTSARSSSGPRGNARLLPVLSP